MGRRRARFGDAVSERKPVDAARNDPQSRGRRIETDRALARPQPLRVCSLYRPDHRRILPQCHPERPGHHAYLRCTERREQREIDHQIRQAVRRHRRLRGLLYGRSEIPRTGILRATHGEEETPPGLYRRLLPRQGGTDGSTRRRHDYDQGHVGPDSADARERAGQAAQTARRRTDRFPHPLHAGLRSGVRPERHFGRSRHRRHQLLVLRRRHGCAGHRVDLRLLQEVRHRIAGQHGGRSEDQRRTERDPPRTGTFGFRSGKARTESLRPADRHPARRDRRRIRQGDRCGQGRRRSGAAGGLPQDRSPFRFPCSPTSW